MTFRLLFSVAVLLIASHLSAQQPPCDEAGLTSPGPHCLSHAPFKPPVVPRRPLPACVGEPRAAVSDTNLWFHHEASPIDIACGDEARRSARFDRLRAWVTDLWGARQFPGKNGDVDADRAMSLHSVVSLMQQRQRLSVQQLAVAQALEASCRCRVGYVLNTRGEAWPSDEVREP